MATDMDIEMDLDLGLMEEELEAPVPDAEISSQQLRPTGYTPNDMTEADALDLIPNKVHVRGLDSLTTKDIKLFALEYFDIHQPSHIEWIDDTSANIVYETAEIARQALNSFSLDPQTIPHFPKSLETTPARPLSHHPETRLEVRLAVVGDRKQARAREKSRFYLLNPEHDRAERKRTGYKNNNRYRDREDERYRSQRYDDREQRKREDGDANTGFDESLYDDDEAALSKRASRHNPRDSSGRGELIGGDQRRVRFHGNTGKDLFPNRETERGRLRNRSASPARESDGEDFSEVHRRRQQHSVSSANRAKAQNIKAQLRESSSNKELFPHKINTTPRRSDDVNSADATADLFSSRMSVPFMDGSTDNHPNDRLSLASRIKGRNVKASNSPLFTIRGAASSSSTDAVQGFNIKGSASRSDVKELFPSGFGDNTGKELFSERLEGRGGRRQKAEDLFS